MGNTDKLLQRFQQKPKDFHWRELVAILRSFGYSETSKGKTGGSRRRFECEGKSPITLHEPHPKGILKAYQIKQIIEKLKDEELI